MADSPTGGLTAAQFKQAISFADNSRPITGNTVQTPYLSNRLVDEFSLAMDVQSFSHQFENVPAYHAVAPWKAVGLGESGSCQCDRGEFAEHSNRTSGVQGFGGVLDCVVENLQALAIPYSYGSFSWTLMDYLGETDLPWPDTSSHYGAFDLAGFAKDTVGLYSAWWPATGEAAPDCTRISLSPTDWTAPAPPGAAITVAAFTCAPFAELLVDGVAVGAPQPVPYLGYVAWSIQFSPGGNITARALASAGGAVLGTAVVRSAGAPYALRLWVESPYLKRNGSVIAADGADAAVLGVAVLDASGVEVPSGSVNVTFGVEGAAKVYGVANGWPSDHSPVKGTNWRLTYHVRSVCVWRGGRGARARGCRWPSIALHITLHTRACSQGKARLIITSAGEGVAGGITVTASAPGLVPSSVGLLAQ